MNIYIYGSKSFKKQIHSILDHSNVKFRLDSAGKIEEIESLAILKLTIQEHPDHIFLIDHEKIIDSSQFGSRIGFLRPKDGIDKAFLEEYGIGDLVVDNASDIGKHIVKKLEKLHLNDLLDEEDQEALIHKEIEEESVLKKKMIQVSDGDLMLDGLDEVKQHLDDLDALDDVDKYRKQDDLFDSLEDELIVQDDEQSHTNIVPMDDVDSFLSNWMDEDKEVEQKFSLDEDFDGLLVFEDVINQPQQSTLTNKNEDDFFDQLQIETIDNFTKGGEKQMSDEDLLQMLDAISEDEMKQAVSSVATNSTSQPLPPRVSVDAAVSTPSVSTGINNKSASKEIAFSSDVSEIAQLISELLKNKTIEISIRVKE